MARRKNPVLEADKALQKEGEKQALLIHGAAALAMFRHWGWRKNRIMDMLDKVEEVWNECAKDIDHSMIEMCDTETGIEIQCGDGKTWKDLHYLNHKVDPGRMTPAKWIYMRRQQKKWMAPQVVAGILLALHRKCGFGFDRCARVYAQICEIQQEYNQDPQKVAAACLEETNVKIHDKLRKRG